MNKNLINKSYLFYIYGLPFSRSSLKVKTDTFFGDVYFKHKKRRNGCIL